MDDVQWGCSSDFGTGRVPDCPKPFDNRRNGVRRRTLLGGVIVHGPAFMTSDCAVRDMSNTGAQIRLSALTHLARPTVLLVPKLERAFEVTVAWQRGTDLGLTFTREIDLNAGANAQLDRTVQRIWQARRF